MPARHILSRIAATGRAVIGPRLGRLRQYRAKPLRRLPPASMRKLVGTIELPSIGIVTPSYQQGRFLAATITSVLYQNYPSLKYRVQDGGSTDNSLEVLRSFGDHLSGWQIGPDGGQPHALNRGFAALDTAIMAYLNSDDLLLPGALHIVGDYFGRHPDVDVIYGDRILIDEGGQEIGDWRLPAHNSDVLSWVDYVPQETLFWRKSAWDRIGGRIDESFRFAMDWDLLLRLRDSGARFVHLPRFLGAFRVHAQQKTSASLASVGRQEMQILRRRSLGFEPTAWQIRAAVMPYLAAHLVVDLRARLGEVLWRRAEAEASS